MLTKQNKNKKQRKPTTAYYGTVMTEQPCMNPNCKSHGKPHPNCKCHGNRWGKETLAMGGEVPSFCSTENAHDEDCEYFADGGEVKGLSGTEVPLDDLPDGIPSGGISGHEVPPEELSGTEVPESELGEKPTDYVETAKAGAEGLARGLIGDLAKVAQVKSGVSTLEDIERRESENPITATTTKTVGRVVPFLFGPVGAGAKTLAAKAIQNFIIGVSYAASDNATKVLLDQPGGNPKEAVANTLIDGGIDGLLYTVTGGLFSKVGKAKVLQDPAIAKAAEDVMLEIAKRPLATAAAVTVGAHAPEIIESEALKHLGSGSLAYGVARKQLDPYIQKIVGEPFTRANRYAGDAVLNALAKTDFFAIPSGIRYAQKIAAGGDKLSPVVDGFFKSTTHAIKESETPTNKIEKIKEWVESGGVDRELQSEMTEHPGFAEGGVVDSPRQAFASLYPTQNVMLSATRGRVYNYLNSIRPTGNEPKLPFDRKSSQKENNKKYDRAIEIAANPISVLNRANDGTLTPEHMQHLTNMYPEVYEHMSGELSKRIVKAQIDNDMPSYKKRKSMSLFLGANLDSTFTPQSIQAVQMMYASRGAQQQQMPKSSAKMKTPNSYLTSQQANVNREQNSKN